MIATFLGYVANLDLFILGCVKVKVLRMFTFIVGRRKRGFFQ